MKISEAVSRIKNTIKAVKSDAFLTDRFVYSIILKHGLSLINQYLIAGGYKYAVFTKLPYVEMKDIDKIESVCNDIVPIYSNCIIKKSIYPLPKPLRTSQGPVIRSVVSLDYSKKYFYIHPDDFSRLTNITIMKRWNNFGYYYIDEENYLYLFNENSNDVVIVEGMFVDYTKYVSCNLEKKCVSALDYELPFNEELLSMVEANVLKELLILYQVPTDVNIDDNKSIVR